MNKLARLALFVLPALFMTLSSAPMALAAPPTGPCQGSGEHQEINAKRFSFKGVISGISSDSKTISLCGVPVDISSAKVKGDVQAAKSNGWQVSVVGQVAGTAHKAQEVRVHAQGEPSGVAGKTEDKDEDAASHGSGSTDGKSQGKPGEDYGKSSQSQGKATTDLRDDANDSSDPKVQHNVSATGADQENRGSDSQHAVSDNRDSVERNNGTGNANGGIARSSTSNQGLAGEIQEILSLLQSFLARLRA